MPAVVKQVSISQGGMPKLPVPTAAMTATGLEGDWQSNQKYHGGLVRAICLFSAELYDRLRDLGIELAPGTVGENITTAGIDLDALRVGDRLRIGEGVIEITDVRTPCRNLNRLHPQLLQAMKGHSGWVAKVMEAAQVSPGNAVELLK